MKGGIQLSKVIIIGGGIAGMTAGILLQKAGYETEIYEKNNVVGGLCTGWKRDGYYIDNCVDWLTGSREGNDLNDLWKEIGVLGEGVELYKKEIFFSSELDGQVLTFWRDKERTRSEMLKLSPEDEVEINKMIDYVGLAEDMTVPVEKPYDAMNMFEFLKLGMSMKAMMKVMKDLGSIELKEYSKRFKHPLIQRSLTDYMRIGSLAYEFIFSYATITAGNGDIPMGGSLAMACRIADRYKQYGGIINTKANVKSIILKDKKAEGIILEDNTKVNGDYIICACDTYHIFNQLLPKQYMNKELIKEYETNEGYSVNSAFQIAFAVDGVFDELTKMLVFPCREITVGRDTIETLCVQSYNYDHSFAPKGKMIIQSHISQSEESFLYWKKLYEDKEKYNNAKKEMANEVMERIIEKYPFLEGKIRILDIWTPMTYSRYCNCYKGAYMGFINGKKYKNYRIPGIVKNLDNVYIASQWLMSPGGLPTAAAVGKFAAWRIMKKNK